MRASRNRNRVRRSAFMLCLLLTALPRLPALAAAGSTVRASLAAASTQLNDESHGPSIAGGGRYVAFESYADNAVPGDTNLVFDVFVRDLSTSVTERVSVATGGQQSNDTSTLNYSTASSVSSDGRYVTFTSSATNLASGDTNGFEDVFVRDRTGGTTARISVSSSGAQGNEDSVQPAISGNGRYVVFESRASNLVAGDTNAASDVFRYDRTTAQTVRVSVRPDGTQVTAPSYQPAVDASGLVVTFYTTAGLVAADTNGEPDVYVRDVGAATTTLVSRSSTGAVGNAGSVDPSVSPDGRIIAYSSPASNLVVGDTNGTEDIFLFDRTTATTTRVSVATGGAQATGGSYSAAVSNLGQFVAFSSLASDLTIGDTNGSEDVFVHERATGVTRKVSMRHDTQVGGDSSSLAPSITDAGSMVAYESVASNLVSADTNFTADIFASEPDTIAPAAPAITAPAQNLLTNNASVTITGTAERNASIEVRDGSVTLGRVTADPSGTWSLTRTFTDGTHSITARATDVAGNTGALSPIRSFTIDTIAPLAPSITAPAEGAVVLSAPLVVGGTAEPNASVAIRQGTTTLGTVVASPTGAWSATLVLSDGGYAVTARATDAAGNTGPDSPLRRFTVDVSPPPAPTIGSPVEGAISNARPIAVAGSAEAGASVTVRAGSTTIGTTTAGGTGAWSLSATLADGPHSITATATDVHGRSGPASGARSFTIDTVAPGPTTIDSPTNDSLHPAAVSISGRADPWVAVRVFSGAQMVKATQADATGAWQAALTLQTGTHTLTARGVDAAGNLGAPSAAVKVVVDKTGPVVTVTTQNNALISAPTTDEVRGSAVDANGVARIEVTFTDALGRSLGTVDATCTGCGARSAAGVSWRIEPPAAPGPMTVTVRASDLVDNVSSVKRITIVRV